MRFMEETKIIKTIKKVLPAVVSIVISKSLEAIEKEIPEELWHLLPFENHHLDIPKDIVDAQGMVKVGGGSGFVVDPDGIILTNKHVIIDPNAEYTILTSDNKKFQGTVLARDPIDDVAILKINARGMKAVEFGDSSKLNLGQTVLAIGNALGLFQNTVSAGIISGLSRSILASSDPSAPAQELRGLIQTDAAINPGNSGGPLVTLDGKTIGINAAIVFGAQNLGFAIPINFAKRDLDDLKKHGRIRRPLLGLRYINIDENIQAKMKLPVNSGALVAGEKLKAPAVIKNSPADKADIKEQDIIVECDGKKVTFENTIQDILEKREVGDMLSFTILRDGKSLEKKVKLAERK